MSGGHQADLKVLIAEPLAEEGIRKLREEHTVDVLPELKRQEFLDAIGEYDAVIVRSATQIDKEAIDKGWRLKVVGRAGIGLDNIDVEAATRRGILVVNAPQSNILSAAEHTMALLLSMARQVPAADASLKSGKWERSRFNGVELHGKTLGVIGMGRIGTLVAQRAQGFGMRIDRFRPLRQREPGGGAEDRAGAEPRVRCCSEADFLTIHLPKTSETKGLHRGEGVRRDEAGCPHRQHCPGRDRRRGGAGASATRRASSRRPPSTSSPRSPRRRSPVPRSTRTSW